MTEETHVHMPPKGRIEWNLNTVVAVTGFVLTVISMLALRSYDLGAFASDVKAMDARLQREIERIDTRSDQRRAESEARWRDHENLHKERSNESAATFASVNTRISGVEADTRKFDNQAYRITVLEEAQKNTTTAMQDIKAKINDISSDQKVMREILQRMDKNNPGSSMQDNDAKPTRPF